MRKLFLVLAVVALTGCYRYTVVVSPAPQYGEDETPICEKVDETRADAMTLVNQSVGVRDSVWVFESNYTDRQLVRIDGPNRYLMVVPTCKFGVESAYGEPRIDGHYTIGGFSPYRDRTLLVVGYDFVGGALGIQVFPVQIGEQPFLQQYWYYTRLGTYTYRPVNYLSYLPYFQQRPFLGGGNRIIISFDPKLTAAQLLRRDQ